MAGDDKKIIIINGKKWEDVTNTTHTGISYPIQDVIKCKGDVPNFASNE